MFKKRDEAAQRAASRRWRGDCPVKGATHAARRRTVGLALKVADIRPEAKDVDGPHPVSTGQVA